MRSADIPIPELRRYLLLNRQGDKTKKERRSILTTQLERIDKRMAELETVRKKLKEKIKYYDEHKS
jgi:DNA-binding transcriptional MerR regulator